MEDVVIVGMARTPIGDFGGELKTVSAVELGVIAAREALSRAGIAPELVSEVVAGMIYKGGAKGNPARQVQIQCGMPVDGQACTVDQQCASGMKAFELAVQSVQLGKAEVAVAVGMESMSRAPYYLLGAREGYRMGHQETADALLQDGLVCAMLGYHMGLTAETLAERHGISRQEQDELALLSHRRAIAARERGIWKQEIVPVTLGSKKGTVVIAADEHPRVDLTLAALAAMKPAFKKNGTVTAGNASSLNDGAAALVVTSVTEAARLGAKPLGRVVATASCGVEPEVMGLGPVVAIPKVLRYAGLTMDDIGYFEINEAFAAQFLAVQRELHLDMNRVNANGSGIGLGHPVGSTGARILISLLHEMTRRNVRYGLASLCVGGGPAMAVVLENLSPNS